MILTHLVMFKFFAGASSADAPPVVPPATTTNNYAGGYLRNLWIAHINGKRLVGTYEEIQEAVEGVVAKTEKKPRIVIKPLRTVEQVQAQMPEPTIEAAKEVQKLLYMDVGIMLAAVMKKRMQDDEDDIEAILTML